MGGRVFQATGIASAKVLGFKSFVERNSETLVPTLVLIRDKSHPPTTLPTEGGSDVCISESVTT